MEIELEEKLNAENYTVEDLSSKFKLSILSGDNEIKTSEFAKLLDIEDAIGDLSPEEKQRKIKEKAVHRCLSVCLSVCLSESPS